MELISNISNAKKYKDAIIVREGDLGDEMYIVLKGRAEVYQNYRQTDEIKGETLGPNDFFGEMSLFLGRKQRATVVARDEVIVLGVKRENIFEFFRQQPEFTFSLLATICARLEGANLDHEESEPHKQSMPDVSAQIPPKAEEVSAPPMQAAAGQVEEQAEQFQASSLFPEGHGSYTLPIDNSQATYFYEKKYTCPICGHVFNDLVVRASRLLKESVDPDMRVRYKDVEPLYYDVLSCPNCLYSALNDTFAKVSLSSVAKSALDKALAAYRPEVKLRIGADRDTFTVFAGYYLALICAPLCLRYSQLTTGKLWVKLGRIYGDCGDEAMSRYANELALKDHMSAYEKADITRTQALQIYMVSGELNYKLGDFNAAREFFFKAKTDKDASNLIKRQCENRLEDIRTQLRD